MKKIFLIVAAACAAMSMTSCLNKGQSSYKYTMLASLEYDGLKDAEFFGESTHFNKYDMYFDIAKFCGKRTDDDNKDYLGGFAYCYQKDTILVDREKDPDPFVVYDCDKMIVGNHYMVYRKVADESINSMKLITIEHNADPASTCKATAIFLANTTESVVRAMGEDGFTSSDWASVTVTGYKGTYKTGEATLKLFDKGEPIKTWTMLKLEGLGDIDGITMSLDASKEGIVESFAVDLFVAEVELLY